MQAILAKIALAFALLFGAWFLGYHTGKSNQKTVYVTQQVKANAKVVEKNEKMQDAADKEAKIQIVYKDRIITKYEVIEKEIIKYETTPAATVLLDPEFVRLHDFAATDNEVQAASAASPVTGTDQATPVTTGEAINVIADNYKSFYECKVKVEGWQRYYTELQKTVSD